MSRIGWQERGKGAKNGSRKRKQYLRVRAGTQSICREDNRLGATGVAPFRWAVKNDFVGATVAMIK